MDQFVRIWADESCLGVQFTDRDSPGGAAGLVEYWRESGWTRRDYWVCEPATTNNRMALRSAIEGLRLLRRSCRVIFTSDSLYLVRGMSEWVHAWARRGWRRRTGTVENLSLWRELVAAARAHEVEWRWVRGHAGHPQNEYANILAVRAAKTQQPSNGPVESGFEAWLETQREERGLFMDFHEWAPPVPEPFRPAPPVDEG